MLRLQVTNTDKLTSMLTFFLNAGKTALLRACKMQRAAFREQMKLSNLFKRLTIATACTMKKIAPVTDENKELHILPAQTPPIQHVFQSCNKTLPLDETYKLNKLKSLLVFFIRDGPIQAARAFSTGLGSIAILGYHNSISEILLSICISVSKYI